MKPSVIHFPIVSVLLVSMAGAQPLDRLDPPAGSVTPTGRFGPRIEVNSTYTPGDADSSFVISQPGSYYLADNITGESAKYGIKITAGDVTLDLNGFALIGVGGSLSGINVSSAQLNIAIRNGTIRDWGSRGLSASNASDSQFQDLRASGNGAPGLQIGSGCVLVGCTANDNTNQGINAGVGCTITDCTAESNSGTGFVVGDDCALAHCTTKSNTATGFVTGQGCSLESCTAASNGSDGFDAGNSSSLLNCAARGNTGDGIDSGQRSTITSCSARQNGGNGIHADGDTYVIGCNSSNNTGHGIYADQGDTHIRRNTCNDNTGSGIYTSSSQYYISVQENHACRNSQAGISVQGQRCFIVKNWASGNSPNYDIAANNHYGQIVTSPGANFNQGAWANFAH